MWRLPFLLMLTTLTAAEDPVKTPEHKKWSALTRRVEVHVKEMSDEVFWLFAYTCKAFDTSKYKQRFSRNEVQVPSCAEMKERGYERYYGNVNLLLAEAWRAKILDGLLHWLDTPELPPPLTTRPKSDILFAREPQDGMLSGSIFVSQLLQVSDGMPADAALMLGIHRGPKHKLMRHLGGRKPQLNVTDAIVAHAQKWAEEQSFSTLYVCPLEGDDGRLRRRLEALGFSSFMEEEKIRKKYRFGKMNLHDEVCEEAALMQYLPASAASSGQSSETNEMKSEL